MWQYPPVQSVDLGLWMITIKKIRVGGLLYAVSPPTVEPLALLITLFKHVRVFLNPVR